MKQTRFNQIEREIAAQRKNMDDESDTARAIDRNDPWEEIARAARRDGNDELATLCDRAAAEWA